MSNSVEGDANASQDDGERSTAGTPVSEAGARAREIGAQAKTTAHDLIGEVVAEGTAATSEIKDRAASIVTQQKDQLADKIEDIAQAVHKSGEQMEGHQDMVAQLIERGANELSTLAVTLRNNDLQGLLGNIGSLARRQPGLFAGVSIAAGFALTRIGKLALAGATKDDLPKIPEFADEQG